MLLRVISQHLCLRILLNILIEVRGEKNKGSQNEGLLEGQLLAALDEITGRYQPHLDLPSKQVE